MRRKNNVYARISHLAHVDNVLTLRSCWQICFIGLPVKIEEQQITHKSEYLFHAMWQSIQERDNIKAYIELALAMISDDEVSEYVHNNERDIIDHCLKALPEWGVWQDECLSQNCLLCDYLIADKLKEMYESQQKEA